MRGASLPTWTRHDTTQTTTHPNGLHGYGIIYFTCTINLSQNVGIIFHTWSIYIYTRIHMGYRTHGLYVIPVLITGVAGCQGKVEGSKRSVLNSVDEGPPQIVGEAWWGETPRTAKRGKGSKFTKRFFPGDSSRDLFIPDRWRSLFHPFKGSLNHPKKVTLNHQVPKTSHWIKGDIGDKVKGNLCQRLFLDFWDGSQSLLMIFGKLIVNL